MIFYFMITFNINTIVFYDVMLNKIVLNYMLNKKKLYFVLNLYLIFYGAPEQAISPSYQGGSETISWCREKSFLSGYRHRDRSSVNDGGRIWS